ncbi:flagellar protein FlgN [Paramaledivibacter caminithermalis]|uniref:FlgN protein n=1 Tax=Paramaledivibacter caminithermalis (strain DSM 15212 / CIP 107654 / DViRD3) TaxID=1121301 RepID=A0A1M6L5Q9_PARC5|nr:flagellar protein FlgN [Paramaledivibacter caminithermalis]SHJ66444.1 FlgN protein [Paramaledivibacter caminithermalis DSM 15212]
MSKSVKQLILALNKEYEIYKKVLEIAKQKRRIIIEGRIKDLDGITSKEQAMIISIGKLENIRQSILKNIANEFDTNEVQNISELSEHLDDESKKEIFDIRDKFDDILKNIKNENDLNSKLIKQSLEYIEFNKNLLTSLENEGSTYGSDADEKDIKSKSNLFDVRI